MSSAGLRGTIPCKDQRPCVILRPAQPVTLAGIRTEPAVSVAEGKKCRAFHQADPGAGAGPSWDTMLLGVPGITRSVPMMIDADAAEGKFNHLGLASDNGRLAPEGTHDRAFDFPIWWQAPG